MMRIASYALAGGVIASMLSGCAMTRQGFVSIERTMNEDGTYDEEINKGHFLAVAPPFGSGALADQRLSIEWTDAWNVYMGAASELDGGTVEDILPPLIDTLGILTPP